MIYSWHCSSCHHEWQATVNTDAICEWCGEDGKCLGKEQSHLAYDYINRVNRWNKVDYGECDDD